MEEASDNPEKAVPSETANPALPENGAGSAFLARACSVVTLLCVFLPMAFWMGGVLEGETVTFITKYSDERTLPQKIFDPLSNDFGMYQARELSYLFDYLDASFHVLLLKHFGLSLFVPLSALLSSLLIILIFRRGVRKTFPGLDRLTGELLLLPFLTCFVVVSTLGVFYRSAKPMLAPVLLALLFHFVRTAQARSCASIPEKRWALVSRQSLVAFALLLVAALFDRQGFFYVLIACLVLLIHCLVTRTLKDMLIAAIAAAVLAHLYNVVIGPALILAVNGYRPDFTFQHIPAEEFAGLPLLSLKAGRLLLSNVATMLGGYYVVGYVSLSAMAAWLGWRALRFYREGTPAPPPEHGSSRISLGFIYVLIVLALQVGMFALMLARHPYIFDLVDHWYWYYPLPFLVTTLFGLALLLHDALPRLGTVHRRLLRVALVLIAASNLLHLPFYRTEMLTSHWFSQEYTQSEMLKASIRNGAIDPRLDEEYTRFFHFQEQQRKR